MPAPAKANGSTASSAEAGRKSSKLSPRRTGATTRSRSSSTSNGPSTTKKQLATRKTIEQPDPATGDQDRAPNADRESGRQLEQIAVLGLAFILGVIGIFVHVLWFGSIVVMAVLLGLSAAELRGRHGQSVVSATVAEVKSAVEDIRNPVANDEPATSPARGSSG